MSAAALGGGGCATSGPNHVYVTVDGSPAVHDLGLPRSVPADTAPADKPRAPSGEQQGKEIARAVAPGERVLGLAYDFNTDHLFLRIAPAQVIRVIERPSGRILREMLLSPDNSPADEVVGTNTGPAVLPRSVPEDTAPADKPRAPSGEQQGAGNGAASTHSADLAIRSSDRHLFAVHADGRSVVELTLFGDFVRRLEPSGLTDRIGGLAYDQKNGRLVILTASSPARIGTVAPDGSVIYYMTLQAAVHPVSLGYDSDAQHYYVPLEDGRTLGEFDSTGALLEKHPLGENRPITAVDAGPRSFVRVF